MFVLDTDHVSVLQAGTEPEFSRLLARMDRYSPNDFCVTIVSFHEEVLGWHAYINRARRAAGVIRGYHMFEELLRFFNSFQVLSYDEAASNTFASLRQQKIRIGPMDLRIASIALAAGFTVLTRNLTDFRQVPGLRAEDWMSLAR